MQKTRPLHLFFEQYFSPSPLEACCIHLEKCQKFPVILQDFLFHSTSTTIFRFVLSLSYDLTASSFLEENDQDEMDGKGKYGSRYEDVPDISVDKITIPFQQI